MRVTGFFLLVFLFQFGSLSATDSTAVINVPTRLGYYFENEFSSGKFSPHVIDTQLQSVRKVNAPLDRHYNFLGTNGSAAEPMIFKHRFQSTTVTRLRSFDIYLKDSENIRYYQTNKRYSQIDWHQGNFKEQAIRFLHTQNIVRGWNAGIDFKRLGLKDFTAFSRTFHSDLLLFTSYRSPDQRYNLFAHAEWVSINNQVNGGVPEDSDSLFLEGNISNLGIKGLGFQIGNASQRYRHRKFYVSQYYTLRNKTDSLAPGIRLNYRAGTERFTYAYLDETPDSTFYDNFFYGSKTSDSLFTDVYTNRFSISLPAGKRRILPDWNTEYYLTHQYVRFGQVTSTNWNNLLAGGVIRLLNDSGFNLNVSGEFVLQGYDRGNLTLQGMIRLPLKKLGTVTAGIVSGRSSADQPFRRWESNNFIWTNNFSKINHLSVYGTYENPEWKTGITFKQLVIDRWVYLNTSAIPEQTDKVVSIQQVSAYKNFVYRSLHFDNSVTWQSSSESIIPLPSFVNEHALYIEKNVFKKAMLLNTGVSVTYNSSYFANGFMPSGSMFHLQNELKTGGFARLDFYVSFRIKTARVFFMLENAGDNLTGNAYYLTPHYPMPGRVFKFGISWRFFD